MSSSSERRLREEPLELADLLDRLLDTGVVLRGKILIRVAEIDLIYLDLSLVLCSIDKMLAVTEPTARPRAALLDFGGGSRAALGVEPAPPRLH
ncbi:MAG: gas vesicle protein [Xanthomonadales bacterium]|nr:gas vesicle protein [Xanthomonadales bacterium]